LGPRAVQMTFLISDGYFTDLALDAGISSPQAMELRELILKAYKSRLNVEQSNVCTRLCACRSVSACAWVCQRRVLRVHLCVCTNLCSRALICAMGPIVRA